jgi:cytochrome P450
MRHISSQNDHEAAALPTSQLPSIVQTYLFWRWPHAYLERRRGTQGNRFAMSPVGLPPSVFFSAAEDIMAVLMAPADVLHPGAGAAAITPLVGERSFILLEEAQHMTGRRAIMPAFHYKAVTRHAAAIERIVERETASWPSDKPIALHPYLRALTLRVILWTIFRVENALVAELHHKLLAMLDITDSLTLQEPQLRVVPGWRGLWRGFMGEHAAVDALVRALIRDGTDDRESVLSLLLCATNPDSTHFTVEQIRDSILSLVVAGHETTAAQLAWTFQLIAHDPRVLGELLIERDRDGDAYLRATVQEAMRHRPVFLCAIPRVLHHDFELAGACFRPHGQLLACIHLLHHEPQLYRDAERFLPERFLDNPPRPPKWLPWGGGRKRCPGNHLALLEMQLVLRAVLERWEILPVTRTIETAKWRSVIVTPSHGSRVILRTRRHQPAHRSYQATGEASSRHSQPSSKGACACCHTSAYPFFRAKS